LPFTDGVVFVEFRYFGASYRPAHNEGSSQWAHSFAGMLRS